MIVGERLKIISLNNMCQNNCCCRCCNCPYRNNGEYPYYVYPVYHPPQDRTGQVTTGDHPNCAGAGGSASIKDIK